MIGTNARKRPPFVWSRPPAAVPANFRSFSEPTAGVESMGWRCPMKNRGGPARKVSIVRLCSCKRHASHGRRSTTMGFHRQDLQEAFLVPGTHTFGAPGFQGFPLRTDHQSRSWEPGKPPRPARSGAWLRHHRPAGGRAATRLFRSGAQPAARGRADLRQRLCRWPTATRRSDRGRRLPPGGRGARRAGDGERERARHAGRGAPGAGLRRSRPGGARRPRPRHPERLGRSDAGRSTPAPPRPLGGQSI
jgi:hypothetical protein